MHLDPNNINNLFFFLFLEGRSCVSGPGIGEKGPVGGCSLLRRSRAWAAGNCKSETQSATPNDQDCNHRSTDPKQNLLLNRWLLLCRSSKCLIFECTRETCRCDSATHLTKSCVFLCYVCVCVCVWLCVFCVRVWLVFVWCQCVVSVCVCVCEIKVCCCLFVVVVFVFVLDAD